MHPCCLNQIVGQVVIMGRNSLTISGRFLGLPSSYKRTQNPWRVCAGPRNWQHPFTEFKSVRLCQRRGKPGSGKENLLTVLVEADCSSLRQLTYYQILCMLTVLTLLLAQEERKKNQSLSTWLWNADLLGAVYFPAGWPFVTACIFFMRSKHTFPT